MSGPGSTGSYAVTGLQAVAYSLLAVKDSNGDGQPNAGDYLCVYLASGATDATLVPPPQTGLAIQMVDIADLQRSGGPGGVTPAALRAAARLMGR